jgi:hypothetical protein
MEYTYRLTIFVGFRFVFVSDTKNFRSRVTEKHYGKQCESWVIPPYYCAAGIGLGTTMKYLRRSTSGAAGNGLLKTIKYLRGATDIGMGTTIKYLRRTTSAAANNGLGITIKYLLNQNAGAENNWAKSLIHESWAQIQMNPPAPVV